MTLSKDLFLSILSMDAYNRGYDEGIGGLGGLNSQIGNAAFTKQSDAVAGSPGVAAGFYASAYTLNGETIISYRGRDKYRADGATGGDIWNGWAFGAGFRTDQLSLAREFYGAITGTSAFSTAGNALLVGHSLGGDLAGLTTKPT